MTFAEKLELLISITGLSNSTLARQISVDASAISRLRRGVRNPARKATYIEPMAQTFARLCKSDYQKIALKEAIKADRPGFIFIEDNPWESIIYEWLNEDEKDTSETLDEFMHNFINFQFKKEAVATVETNDIKFADDVPEKIDALYGKEGKQKAVLAFLSLVLENHQPQTLYLYSDENIEWLVDPQFRVKWASLMVQIILKGHRIKIIHDVARNFDEMLSGINEWLPLYMTGVIEPYYYPKNRDGLFKQTLFIATNTAAIASSTVSNNSKAPNLLITDKTMINILIEEFKDFLILCRPLMHIFTPYNHSVEYLALLKEFEDEISNTIIKTNAFSCITMPPAIIKSIFSRLNSPKKEELISYHLNRMEKFNKNLKNNTFIEIITPATPTEVTSGKIPVDFSDMLNDTPLFYSPDEYLKHLKNIIKLLKANENYLVIISPKKLLAGSMVYVKEDVGVLVGKTALPSTIFAINESNMTAAFWDYMHAFIAKNPSGNNRIQTIDKLENIIKNYS